MKYRSTNALIAEHGLPSDPFAAASRKS